MGGHGALVCALRYPDLFRSVSALASIFAPHACTLGREGLHRLPQGNRETWKANDASELVGDRPFPDGRNVLVDQGLADQSLEEQLRPQTLEEARAGARQPLTLNRRQG
jgi:S-formylglutathione hydrolase